jgi:hypothetical protein
LSVECLEGRAVPAVLVWDPTVADPVTGFFPATTAANWDVQGTFPVQHRVPTSSDDLVFPDTPVEGGMEGGYDIPNVDCTGLHGTFDAVLVQEGFLGSITLDGALTVGAMKLAGGKTVDGGVIGGGEVYLPGGDIGGADITVTGSTTTNSDNGSLVASLPAKFYWKAGNISSVAGPLVSTLTVATSGKIERPDDGTLSCADTINFTNPTANAAIKTIITGAGTILMTGNSAGVNVEENAGVVTQVAGGKWWRDNGAGTITLYRGSNWGYEGFGTETLSERVINYGGEFWLGDPDSNDAQDVWLTMTGGNETTPSYTNVYIPFFGYEPSLEIMNGSMLIASKGVQIDAGNVWLIGNELLPLNYQVATIKGTFTMNGGAIQFRGPVQPSDIEVFDYPVWGQFRVDGDAFWYGGQYNPGLDCRANMPEVFQNNWEVTGTLTVGADSSSGPIICPVPQRVPPDGGPAKTWNVITADVKIQGSNPSIVPGWILGTVSDDNGVLKKFTVRRNANP